MQRGVVRLAALVPILMGDRASLSRMAASLDWRLLLRECLHTNGFQQAMWSSLVPARSRSSAADAGEMRLPPSRLEREAVVAGTRLTLRAHERITAGVVVG
jgi:hypothetical protein